ncbi:MAG: hypothetical protein ABI867_37990 [Kofleriaceae bacterium]
MRTVLVVIALVGCAQKADAPPAEVAPPAPVPVKKPSQITVPELVLRVGDTLETVEHDEVVTKPGATVDVKISTDRNRRLEVLAVAVDVVTKARITYTKDAVTTVVDGKPIPDYTLAGAPFVVSWVGDKPAITREDGSALTTELSRRLTDDLRGYLGHPDYVVKAVATAPFEVGTARPLADKQLARALGDIATVRHAVIRLLATRDDTAQLEQVLVYEGEEDSSAYRATTRNLVDISITSGRRIRQVSAMTLHFDRFDFELTSTVRYQYVTPGR